MHAAVLWTQKQIPYLINKQRAFNEKHALCMGYNKFGKQFLNFEEEKKSQIVLFII